MRARKYVVAAAAAAMVASGSVVAAQPASAAGCPVVLPSGTVLVSGVVGFVGCDLDGADLDGFLISGNLASSSLVGATLRGAVLRGVNLTGSNFTNADLTGADLTGATGTSVVLDGASFDGAQLARATLTATSAGGATLTTAHLAGSTVRVLAGIPALPTGAQGWTVADTYLIGPGAVLDHLTLTGAQVHGVSLYGTDLRESQIIGGSFSGSDLTGADLRDALVNGVDFTGATGYAGAAWDGAVRYDITCPDGIKIVKHDHSDCLAPVDTTAPVVVVGGSTDRWTLSGGYYWPLTFHETGSGLDTIRWRIRSTPAGRTSWTSWAVSDWEGATTSTRMYSYPQELSGRTTCVMAQVRDAAGNVSSWTAERCSQIPYDQLQIFHSYSGFVERSPGTGDWIGGSYLLSRKRGSELGLGDYVVVKRLGVVATTCPTCGSVAVFLGRTKLATFSLARSTTTMRSLVLTTLPTTVRGRLRLVVTSADGRTVRLDGVAVSAS